MSKYKPFDPTGKTIEEIVQCLKGSHECTTRGLWGRGISSHETAVTDPRNGELFHVATFRYSDDALFADIAHNAMPVLIAKLEELLAKEKTHGE